MTTLEIRLDERVAVCFVCDAESPPRWGIPYYEGYILPNSWPGEWGGVDACQSCWEYQQELIEPVLVYKFRSLVGVQR